MDIRPIVPVLAVTAPESDAPRPHPQAKRPAPQSALDPQVLAAAQASLPAGLVLQVGLAPGGHRVIVQLVDQSTGQLICRFPPEHLQDPRWLGRMTGRLINTQE